MSKEGESSFIKSTEKPLLKWGGLAAVAGFLINIAPLAVIGGLSIAAGIYVGGRK